MSCLSSCHRTPYCRTHESVGFCLDITKYINVNELGVEVAKEKYFVGISTAVQQMLIENSDPYSCINAEVVTKVKDQIRDQLGALERLEAALFMHEQKREYPLTVRPQKKGMPCISISGPDQYLQNNQFVDTFTPPNEKTNSKTERVSNGQ